MLVRRVWPSRPTFEDPFGDLEQARREMLRWFDNAASVTHRGMGAGVFPPLNVTQDADAFYVRAEVPGIQPSELTITALRNRLSIAGKREIPAEKEKASYHRKERAEGSFNRTLTLPMEVDSERVDARYADGLLTLKLPKAEAAKPRQIKVHT